MQLIRRFLKDNLHLQLLHTAKSTPLHDIFAEAILLPVQNMQSTKASTSEIEQLAMAKATYSEPPKHTLAALLSSQVTVLNVIYKGMFRELEEVQSMPLTIRKFQYINWNNKKVSSLYEGTNTISLPVPMFLQNQILGSIESLVQL